MVKNFLYLNLFISFLTPQNSQGQKLKNHMITPNLQLGGYQQKVGIGYSYSIVKFKSLNFDDRSKQIFSGVEFGATNFNYSLPSFISRDIIKGDGYHYNFVITTIVSMPKHKHANETRQKFRTIKFGINHFINIKAHFPCYDSDNDRGKYCVFDAEKCNSYDFEFSAGRLFKINNNNFIRLGSYYGFRMGSVYGTLHDNDGSKITVSKTSYSLPEFIFGFSIGFQTNFSKSKISNISSNPNGL